MLRVHGLTHYFGEQMIFDDISFGIGNGERVGLVGANGSGKSTLLHLLSGRQMPAGSGRIERPQQESIFCFQGYPDHLAGRALDRTEPSAGAGRLACCKIAHLVDPDLCSAKDNLEEASKSISGNSDLEALDRAQRDMDKAGGWTKWAQIEAGVRRLGFDLDLEQHMSQLSGGELVRLSLIGLTLKSCRLALLDEPTVSLDLGAVKWLVELIEDTSGDTTFVIVSHDRRFLDRTTDRTLVIDSPTSKVLSYSGNYSWYRERKKAEDAKALVQHQMQVKKIKQLEDDYRSINQQAAKTEKETTNDYIRARAKKVAAKAQARKKRVELMLERHRKDKPFDGSAGKMRLSLKSPELSSGHLVTMDGVELSYDEKVVLSEVNLEVRAGERICLVGPNGAGKTTLLRAMLGQIEPSGGRLWINERRQARYLTQWKVDMDMRTTVLDWLTQEMRIARCSSAKGSWEPESEIRTFLSRLQLRGNQVYRSASQLSEGERTKLLVARLMLSAPDLIVLDEPTNHLDIDSLSVLEESLKEYAGACLVASHDHVFIEALEPDWIWLVEDGGVRVQGGDYLAEVAGM